MNIYDTIEGKLIIGPFDYNPIEYASYLLEKDDRFLLKVFLFLECATHFHFKLNNFVFFVKK